MIPILMAAILLNATVPVMEESIPVMGTGPLVFPEAMPAATNSIIAIPQDLAGQENSWWASIRAWLGNDTNLTNTTGLFYA
jgi:hypothetical protein